MNFRLPKDVEWEKAATHPKGDYPWGPNEPTPELMNFDNNVGNPTPVGIYQAGAAPGGHLDMAGNVCEWCEDWYPEYPKRKYTGTKYIASRVFRGGGWDDDARGCRSAYRGAFGPACHSEAGGREATGMTRRRFLEKRRWDYFKTETPFFFSSSAASFSWASVQSSIW